MTHATFYTPGGHEAVMEYRDGTSDWNTIAACLRNPLAPTGDEYRIPSGLSGWGLDVGAHVGAVTVGLLLDNPDMQVIAIEAVPENVELLKRNVRRNGVLSRCDIVHAAAWGGEGEIEVEYDYSGSETAEVHRYIGSVSPWISDAKRRKTTVPIVTLDWAIFATNNEGFVWAKSDCEGCEHPFFRGPGLRKVARIVGEWHRRDGTPESLAEQLSKTHRVTWTDGDGQGGPFEAIRLDPGELGHNRRRVR